MFTLGREYVIVFNKPLFDNEKLTEAIDSAIDRSGLNPVVSGEHVFEGNGLTKYWILSESHVALSTWPERNSGVINVFVCDESFSLEDFLEGLRKVIPDARIAFAEKTFEA